MTIHDKNEGTVYCGTVKGNYPPAVTEGGIRLCGGCGDELHYLGIQPKLVPAVA